MLEVGDVGEHIAGALALEEVIEGFGRGVLLMQAELSCESSKEDCEAGWPRVAVVRDVVVCRKDQGIVGDVLGAVAGDAEIQSSAVRGAL